MTAWIIIGAIILFFVCLLSLRAKITICYNNELALFVRVLCVKIRILPKKAKKGPHSMSATKAKKIRQKAAKKAEKKRIAKQEKAEKKAQKKAEKKNAPKKSVGEILDMIDLIRGLLAVIIGRFFKHLRIDVARLRIKVATPDAATTAIAYGAVTQSINLLFPLLEKVKNFSLPDTADLDVQADFLSEAPQADIILSFSIRVWHVLDIAIGALKRFLKHKFKKENNA